MFSDILFQFVDHYRTPFIPMINLFIVQVELTRAVATLSPEHRHSGELNLHGKGLAGFNVSWDFCLVTKRGYPPMLMLPGLYLAYTALIYNLATRFEGATSLWRVHGFYYEGSYTKKRVNL